jgi:hypothetical protein
MRVWAYVLCGWPGLLRLWQLGDWSALGIAAAFGGVLNFLLVSSFVRTELLPPEVNTGGWLLVAGIWLFSAIRSFHSLPGLVLRGRGVAGSAADRGLFIQAQGEYLRGNWFAAESLLHQLLRCSRDDVDAQLMLATLYRRTRRYAEARARLDLIEQSDQAEKWRWELNLERRLMQRPAPSSAEGSS